MSSAICGNPSRNVVRAMHRSDTRATGSLHSQELAYGFFPRLGPTFLRAFHATFVDSPYGVAVVPQSDPDGGFLLGTTDQVAHVRWVLRHRGLRLVLVAARCLLVRPRLLATFVRTRLARYVRRVVRTRGRSDAGVLAREAPPAAAIGQREAGTALDPDDPVAVLWHMAVQPALRGHGYGRSLVAAFVAASAAAGAEDLRLVSDVDADAGGFYEALGWERGEVRRRDGRTVTEFRRSVHPPGAD